MIQVNEKAIQSVLNAKPEKRRKPPIELYKLWAVLGEMYGNRFFSVYGDSPTVGWQLCFTGFAPKKIERGLKNLIESPKFNEWPPTAKQFRDLCLQVSDPANRKYIAICQAPEVSDEDRKYGLGVLDKLKSEL